MVKNLTFALGLSWLVIQSGPIDWDVNISVLMAGLTYLTADRALRWALSWKTAILAILAYWVSVDGVYALYWSLVRPEVLDLMREANFKASTWLYVSCGVIWNLERICHGKSRWWYQSDASLEHGPSVRDREKRQGGEGYLEVLEDEGCRTEAGG